MITSGPNQVRQLRICIEPELEDLDIRLEVIPESGAVEPGSV